MYRGHGAWGRRGTGIDGLIVEQNDLKDGTGKIIYSSVDLSNGKVGVTGPGSGFSGCDRHSKA